MYRGQVGAEMSRIRFLLEAVCTAFDQVDAILLSPMPSVSEHEFAGFVAQFPNIRSCSSVPAGWRSVPGARRRLRELIAPDASRVIAVGFSAASYLPDRDPLAWFVNGVPEERLMHEDSWRQRVAVRMAWRTARRLQATRTVVVSQPMAELIQRRLGGRSIVVPNAVDLDVFRVDSDIEPTYLTYQGGGSPWQGLDRLALVWAQLHRLDPSLRFRVITEDPRAHVLVEGLAAESVEIRSADGADQVAALLQQARLGFLYRAPDLVNEVSWPMKLGEYLGAGAPVVVSRCGWDAERLLERRSAGFVVDWERPPEETAHGILGYLSAIGTTRPPGVAEAATELAAASWLRFLTDELSAIAVDGSAKVCDVD